LRPAVALELAVGVARQPHHQLVVLQQPQRRSRYRLVIVARHEEAGLLVGHDVRNAACPRRHDRQSHREAFE